MRVKTIQKTLSSIQVKTYSEEIHLVNSILELKNKEMIEIVFNHFLFSTRVLSLQNVFLRNMFYFVFY